MARDCKGNSFLTNSKFFRKKIFRSSGFGADLPEKTALRRIHKNPRATFAHLRLNKDLNLGPHD